MRLVRQPSAAEELRVEEQIRREIEEKASQQLLEKDRPNLGLRIIRDIREYFNPTIEI